MGMLDEWEDLKHRMPRGLLDAAVQYVKDAMPGGSLSPEGAGLKARAQALAANPGQVLGQTLLNATGADDQAALTQRRLLGLDGVAGGVTNGELQDKVRQNALNTALSALTVYHGSVARPEIPPTKYELAHSEAQRVAALPVKQGGLGLHPENTAMERARAMGYKDASNDFYGIDHRPPMSDSGAPLHDLTAGNVYPDDIYSGMGARYYGTGDAADASLFAKIYNLKGKPDEMVRTYRAVPREVMDKHGNTMHHGDWVTINRQYAVDHGKNALNGDYRIQADNFPAKSLFTNGDSPYEYGLDKSQYFADGPADIPLMRGTGHNTPDRSRFAAFNPENRDSADLLAGVAPYAIPAGLLGLLNYSGEAEAAPTSNLDGMTGASPWYPDKPPRAPEITPDESMIMRILRDPQLLDIGLIRKTKEGRLPGVSIADRG